MVAHVLHEVLQGCAPVATKVMPHGVVEILRTGKAMTWSIRVQRLAGILLVQGVRGLSLSGPATAVECDHFLALALAQTSALYGVQAPKAIERNIGEVI